MGLFSAAHPANPSGRIPDFEYLSEKDIYVDHACQSLRPQPVIDTLNDYFLKHNACGGRVKYAWGQYVDSQISKTRDSVRRFVGAPKHYTVSFTLNTTYGLNLILSQLPAGYASVVTTDIEHNSVFLSTIECAKRLGITRHVLPRHDDGSLLYDKKILERAIVVVNTVSNIDGRKLRNIRELVADTHAMGGIVIIDAAQTMSSNVELVRSLDYDALCFSGHKMYAPSLGVVIIKDELLSRLQHYFVGGGMVHAVNEHSYELLPDDLSSHLEPGLQDFGAILALGRAIEWLEKVRPFGESAKDYLDKLSTKLFDGITSIDGLSLSNHTASSVISFYSTKHDAHKLSIYLSAAGVMSRSGTFCCHYYLNEIKKSPPLIRFSLGLHNTVADIDTALATLEKVQKG